MDVTLFQPFLLFIDSILWRFVILIFTGSQKFLDKDKLKETIYFFYLEIRYSPGKYEYSLL